MGNNKLVMKYILIMQICSAIYQQCSDPMPNNIPYNSYYDCSTAGYLNALTINQSLGIEEVNKGKILINFNEEVRQSNFCLSSKKYGPKAFNISTLK